MPEVLSAGALELRRSRTSHLPDLMRALRSSERELARWLPWADPLPPEDAERDFLLDGERQFNADEAYGYFLFERETDELVGGIGLHPKEGREVEIGYWVRSDRTHRGYATAAASAITDAAFVHLPDVQRVRIRMDQANHASAAIPRKLGFTLLGEDLSQRVPAPHRSGKGWIWVRRRESG